MMRFRAGDNHSKPRNPRDLLKLTSLSRRSDSLELFLLDIATMNQSIWFRENRTFTPNSCGEEVVRETTRKGFLARSARETAAEHGFLFAVRGRCLAL